MINKRVAEYHEQLFSDEFPLFEEWITKPMRRSLRLNTIRAEPAKTKRLLEDIGAELEPIPWCPEGYWISEGAWGATIPHQLGYFYIQEAASMLPVMVLAPESGDTVLDLCAAPGSKATQIAARCSTLVANEPNMKRRSVLLANLHRCGVSNFTTTYFDGVRFHGMDFDKILLDAPCSDIGNARKNPAVLKTWSLNRARRISTLQKKLIKNAFNLLRLGGTLVYSTCTTTLEENEEVILELLDANENAKLEKIKTKAEGVCGKLPRTENCLRLRPWDNDTESFFVAKIIKE
jgi:NOL1/NOP2/sun family putative RNA methylase